MTIVDRYCRTIRQKERTNEKKRDYTSIRPSGFTGDDAPAQKYNRPGETDVDLLQSIRIGAAEAVAKAAAGTKEEASPSFRPICPVLSTPYPQQVSHRKSKQLLQPSINIRRHSLVTFRAYRRSLQQFFNRSFARTDSQSGAKIHPPCRAKK